MSELLINTIMKVLICISKTSDTTSRIAFKDDNTKFDETGVQWTINPYDEWYALVKAIELKEKDASTVLHLITVGEADCDPIIRKALALGGDEAFRVNTIGNDSYAVAMQIATLAKQNNYDLILTGKETVDYNGSSVGGAIAEILDIPYMSLATAFELNEAVVNVTYEIEGGEEIAAVTLPLVISCQKGVAEQRIPNMRGIMAARTKPLHVLEPTSSETLTSILAFELPATKAGVQLVSSNDIAELVKLLHEEAKVI